MINGCAQAKLRFIMFGFVDFFIFLSRKARLIIFFAMALHVREIIYKNVSNRLYHINYFKYRKKIIEVSHDLPGSKVHGANMGPIWGRQDPGGPHVGPMNFAIWAGCRGIFCDREG